MSRKQDLFNEICARVARGDEVTADAIAPMFPNLNPSTVSTQIGNCLRTMTALVEARDNKVHDVEAFSVKFLELNPKATYEEICAAWEKNGKEIGKAHATVRAFVTDLRNTTAKLARHGVTVAKLKTFLETRAPSTTRRPAEGFVALA